jgi:D-alanyl-D-alanine carboxypeptidase/D-alanyl-D-alanine-endopeptidase (penicillin-binding protein 4)
MPAPTGGEGPANSLCGTRTKKAGAVTGRRETSARPSGQCAMLAVVACRPTACPCLRHRRIVACALATLALGGCGSSSPNAATTAASLRVAVHGHAPRGAPAGKPTAHQRPRAVVDPGLTSLRQTLQQALRGAGPASGMAVEDLTAHRMLFTVRANTGRPPASVEKLYTTTAVLRLLGPDATLQTQVLGTGDLGPRGIWHGNLYFKGGGDPTLGDGAFNQSYYGGYGPTGSQIAEQLYQHGIRRVTGQLYGDESLFDTKRGGLSTDYRPDLPDLGGELSALSYDHGSVTRVSSSPAVFATQQLAAAMRTLHISVRASRKTVTTPITAVPLATVSSPPMRVMLKLMDVPSDDFFAETLAKQLGVRFGGGVGSIIAGAGVISDTIATDYGIDPLILDGSGLSHRDRSTPSQVVTLLRELWQTPAGEMLDASLPVLGVSGTVAGIGLKTAAAGHCTAKTGTLNNITNLAGYCRTKGGHTLAFAFFIDGPPNAVALVVEGQMVADVARY